MVGVIKSFSETYQKNGDRMCQLSSDALQDPLTILHHPAQCPGNLTFLDGHPWLFWPVKGTTRMWEGGNQGMSRYLVPSRGAVG